VVVDISPKAVENSVSFEGVRLFGGIVLDSSAQSNSIVGSEIAATKNSFTSVGLNFGVEYAKSLKKIKALEDFLCSIGVMVDLFSRKKHEGGCETLNKGYDNAIRSTYQQSRTGVIKTGMFSPSLILKAAYRISQIDSVVFLKLIMFYKTAKQEYYGDDKKIADINVSALCPAIGAGIEYKISKKYGAALEFCFPLQKTFKKVVGELQHKIDLSGFNVRLIVTCSADSFK
jgi:hypothetical protein